MRQFTMENYCIITLATNSFLFTAYSIYILYFTMTKLQNVRVVFINSIVCNLAARFPHTEQQLRQSRYLILETYQKMEMQLTKVKKLLAIHYSSVVDRKECQWEWDMLKQCISANFRKEKLQKFALKLPVDEGMKIQSPSLSTLAEIILYSKYCRGQKRVFFSKCFDKQKQKSPQL